MSDLFDLDSLFEGILEGRVRRASFVRDGDYEAIHSVRLVSSPFLLRNGGGGNPVAF